MFRRILVIFLCLCQTTSGQDVATTDYTMEIYIVVDKKAVEVYDTDWPYKEQVSNYTKKEVLKNIDYFLTEVNYLLDTLKPYKISLQAAKSDVVLLDTDIFFNLRPDGKVDGRYALETFDKYPRKLQDYRTVRRLNYDMALLYTGYTLYVNEANPCPSGVSYHGSACNYRHNAHVVTFDGTYKTVISTAQSILLSLGVEYDKENSGYIMDPNVSPDSINRWCFTSDNGAALRNALEKNKQKYACVMRVRNNPQSGYPHVWLSSALDNGDMVCRRALRNASAYMPLSCTNDDRCKRLPCLITGNDNTTHAYVSEGARCGEQLVCKQGKCVPDSNAGLKKLCPSGESNYPINYGSLRCENVLNNQHLCLDEAILAKCCISCFYVFKKLLACESEDQPFCTARVHDKEFCKNNLIKCCKTCSDFVPPEYKKLIGDDDDDDGDDDDDDGDYHCDGDDDDTAS